MLRPGGVFAIVDADWPPVTGVVMAEVAWARLHNRIRVLEARAGAGRTGPDLARPVGEAELVSAGDDLADPHRDRVLADGVTSWAKGDHLARLVSSGRFRFTRELVFHDPLEGGAARVVALMRSQGGYQALRRLGLSDGVIGMTGFERDVEAGFAGASGPLACVLSWRVRMGVV